jgi:TraK protein
MNRRMKLGIDGYIGRLLGTAFIIGSVVGINPESSAARELDYKSGEEVPVFVSVGEPSVIEFPGVVSGGYKNSNAGLAIEKKEGSLIIFGKENMSEKGEVVLVRMQDGRTFPLRVYRADDNNPRDPKVTINDEKGAFGLEETGPKPFEERAFNYAPPSKVSGLMREMVLVAEFGKTTITGYTISEKFKGQTVVSDGTILAKIDKILIGPNLWGYVLDTTNLLDQGQRLNPATFRVDGTRAISSSNWELAPRPLNVEEQLSNKHNTKVYVITRAK